MPRGTCGRCKRDYSVSPNTRVQPTCFRCGQPLRLLCGGDDHDCGGRQVQGVAAVSPAASGRLLRTASRRPLLLPVRVQIGGAVALGLMCIALLGWIRPERVKPAHTASVPRWPSGTLPVNALFSFEAALQEARSLQLRARTKVAQELNALKHEHPDAFRRGEPEQFRRLLLAKTHEIRSAREAARRALLLAKTPDTEFEASLWLASIECDTGHHKAELQHARRLARIRPGSRDALSRLSRAARCNGLDSLARQADVARLTLHAGAKSSDLPASAPSTAAVPHPAAGPADTDPVTPFRAALREARDWYRQATAAVNREREAQLEVNPDEADALDKDDWRRYLLAQDRHGFLRRARREADQAVALARSPPEIYRARSLLASIHHSAGDHQAELAQARQLTSLAPEDSTAWYLLYRAARCCGRQMIARQAKAKLQRTR